MSLSLKPTGIEKSPDAAPSGYPHRNHRSKKGQKARVVFKKWSKVILKHKQERAERKYRGAERRGRLLITETDDNSAVS